MSWLMQANLGLAGLAVLLALAVAAIYLRSHRQLRSPFTLALALFALLVLLHNSVLVYHYVTMMASFDAAAERLMLAEGLLGVGALGSLLYAATR